MQNTSTIPSPQARVSEANANLYNAYKEILTQIRSAEQQLENLKTQRDDMERGLGLFGQLGQIFNSDDTQRQQLAKEQAQAEESERQRLATEHKVVEFPQSRIAPPPEDPELSTI